MKTKLKPYNHYFLLLASILILAQSCATVSITQRRYNKGLHIEWAGKGKLHKKQDALIAEKQTDASVYDVQNAKLPDAIVLENNVQMPTKTTNFWANKKVYSPLQVAKKKVALFENNTYESTQAFSAESATILSQNQHYKSTKKAISSDDPLWLLLIILLAILLPPVAIFLHEGGFTRNVMINLIIVLLSILLGAGVFAGLFSIWGIAVIHAFWVIFFA